MSDMIQIAGHSNLVRDSKSGAIININSNDIKKAKLVKSLRRKAEQDDELLRIEVKTLQNEVTDIKTLLNKILEKL